MKNKLGMIAISLSILTVCGGVLYVNDNKETPVNKQIESTQGTSQMIREELAVKGKIDKIEVTEKGTVINVGDINTLIHASTNIFKDDLLLEITDLEEGQSVEIYSDGVQSELLNGLRVEVLK